MSKHKGMRLPSGNPITGNPGLAMYLTGARGRGRGAGRPPRAPLPMKGATTGLQAPGWRGEKDAGLLGEPRPLVRVLGGFIRLLRDRLSPEGHIRGSVDETGATN